MEWMTRCQSDKTTNKYVSYESKTSSEGSKASRKFFKFFIRLSLVRV